MMCKFLMVPLLATACCVSLGLSAARAEDGGDDEGGGDIQGSETLDVEVMMTPTSAAPAGSSIQASLEADDEDGTTDSKLKLETQGLPAGTYTVTVTLKSDGSSAVLGTFTLSGEESEVEFGDEDGSPFPANINPFDIATISVSDSNGVVLFTADLTSTTPGTSAARNATVQATPGSGNPGASGTAMLNAMMSQGKAKGSVQLSGHGLNPKNSLTVLINGANAKKASTDKSGNVNLRLTPSGKAGTVAPGVSLFNVHSISLRDRFGNAVLSANF
jgi:hypothetical protein